MNDAASSGFVELMDRMTFPQMTLFYFSLFLVFIAMFLLPLQKVWSIQERIAYNDVFMGFLNILGIVYGIMVGTVIVAVWQNFDKAQTTALNEASGVGDLYRAATDLPSHEAMSVRRNLQQYVKHVMEIEWPAMRKGKTPDGGWETLENLQRTLAKSKVNVNKLQTYLGQIYDDRRQRINYSVNNVNYLIYVLIFVLSAIIMLICIFFGVARPWTHFGLCALLALVFSLIISTIVALDWPYRTQITVEPTELARVQHNIQNVF